MAYKEQGILWFVGEADGFVVLAHRPDDGEAALLDLDSVEAFDYWDRFLKLSPACAAGVGASLVAHAVQLDPEGATAAVGRVLSDAQLL